MANTLGPLPFTTKVVSTNKQNGELPAETFSGKVTAKGGIDSPGNVAMSGILLVKGNIEAKSDVQIGGEVNFPQKDNGPDTPSKFKGYVPFTAGATVNPWSDMVKIGGWNGSEVLPSVITSVSFYKTESGIGYDYGAAILSAALCDLTDSWPSSCIVPELSIAVSEVPVGRGVKIEAPDVQGEIGRVPWSFAASSVVDGSSVSWSSTGTANVYGTIPGFIKLDATKLFWKDKEIYVENGVLKLRT